MLMALGKLAHDRDRDADVLAEQVGKLGAVDLEQFRGFPGDGAGEPGLVLEHGHLAEEVAGAELRDGFLAACGEDDVDNARFDDVHRLARIALGKDRMAGRQVEGGIGSIAHRRRTLARRDLALASDYAERATPAATALESGRRSVG